MKLTENIITLDTAEILADAAFNVRGAVDPRDPKIQALARDMKEHGQLAPVIVWHLGDMTDKSANPVRDTLGKSGRAYFLVSGFRRVGAASVAGIPVRAVGFSGTLREAQGVNLKENIARQDLTPAELATRFAELSDSGMSASEIADLTAQEPGAAHKSKGYIVNLVFIRRNLAPELWAHFASGHPRATVDKCRAIAGNRDHAAQLEAWNVLCGLNPDGTNPDQGAHNPDPSTPPRAPSDDRPRKVNDARMVRTIQAVGDARKSMNKSDAELASAIIRALRWARGDAPAFTVGDHTFGKVDKGAKAKAKAPKAKAKAKAPKAPKAPKAKAKAKAKAPKSDKAGE